MMDSASVVKLCLAGYYVVFNMFKRFSCILSCSSTFYAALDDSVPSLLFLRK